MDGNALEPCRIPVDTKSEASEGINEAQAHLDQNVLARYAKVAQVSILGLSGGLSSAAARPGQRPATLFGANVALENRGLETNAENEARSTLLARLW